LTIWHCILSAELTKNAHFAHWEGNILRFTIYWTPTHLYGTRKWQSF